MINQKAGFRIEPSNDDATDILMNAHANRTTLNIGSREFAVTGVKIGYGATHAIAEEIVMAAWTGEGLPPVGAMVEIHKNGYGIRESAEAFMGIPVEVCAVFTAGEGVSMIAVYGGPDLGCEVFRADMARPVRTPEQIAAEDKQKWCRDALLECGHMHPSLDLSILVQSMYDKGYRKQQES